MSEDLGPDVASAAHAPYSSSPPLSFSFLFCIARGLRQLSTCDFLAPASLRRNEVRSEPPNKKPSNSNGALGKTGLQNTALPFATQSPKGRKIPRSEAAYGELQLPETPAASPRIS